MQDYGNEFQAVRNEAMNETLRMGQLNSTQLASELGISKGRVSQLAKGAPPERLFLGSGKVIVALAEKLEDGNDKDGKKKAIQGPVIATEDVQTYERLRDLAEDVGLEISFERIPLAATSGSTATTSWSFAALGYRLSSNRSLKATPPAVRQGRGRLAPHRPQHRPGLPLPMDRGMNSDIAYFGRLPRPDGKGTFLYVAGIHARGSGGVVHWLNHELANVHRELKARRFSTLISSRFDPETLEIVESEQIAPFYRPEGA
ncbi:sigma-70 family RNA polymerase sigma factor [Streptomyces sp. M10(2022)]